MQEEIEEYPLVKVPIDKLIFDPSNPNKSTKEIMQGVRASILEFGFLKPVIINENYEIVEGEHRALGMKALGRTEVQCYIVSKCNDDIKRRLARQTLNKLQGEHDIKLDADEMALIFEAGKLDNLAELIAQERESLENILTKHKGIMFQHEDGFDVDKALEDLVPETTLGDIWQLGQHRIICADCSDEHSINRLMENKRADMVFTDPPYAIVGSSIGFQDMKDDHMIEPFLKLMFRTIKNNLKPDRHSYVCCNWHSYCSFMRECSAVLAVKNVIVWHKHNILLGAMYANSHEFIMFSTNEDVKHLTKRNRQTRLVLSETNVWDIPAITYNKKHLGEKPIELMKRAIGNSTDEGELCFDPFLGSGSTLIACEQTNRICMGVEIDPHYVSVCLHRWKEFTGKEPIRVSDGKTLSEAHVG